MPGKSNKPSNSQVSLYSMDYSLSTVSSLSGVGYSITVTRFDHVSVIIKVTFDKSTNVSLWERNLEILNCTFVTLKIFKCGR